jgi:outer membrane protein, multidrug efflux system
MKNCISIILLAALLGSCTVYKKYESPTIGSDNLYRDTASTSKAVRADTASYLGNVSWQDMFRDTELRKLINQGLANNADLKVALLKIEQAEASLYSARLAYSPQLAVAPSGSLAKLNGSSSHVYSIPLSASWQVPLFGGVLNAKRRAKASLAQAMAYKQAVQTQLVATIANGYYALLALDKKLEVTEQTIVSWGQSLEALRAMKGIGRTNEAAIAQSEANYHSVKMSRSDLLQQIRETENTLCLVLGQAPQPISRSQNFKLELPKPLSTGVPLQLLANRPDVRQAEMGLAAAYYSTNIARSAFYPNLTITGSAGWTNSVGSMVVNPAKFLEVAAGSLAAPIFNRGISKANLRIAKAQQEEAMLSFTQTVLAAGNEVSDALFFYYTTAQKQKERVLQIEALKYSEKYTKELFRLSSSTYLEVLTAQQGLLGAQLAEAEDNLNQIFSMIKLYQALGGGRQ